MAKVIVRLLLASLSLAIFFSSRALAIDNPSLDNCKILQKDQNQVLRIGFTKYPGLIATSGTPKFLVVEVTFPDLITNKSEVLNLAARLDLKEVADRYGFVSGGQFTPIFDVYPKLVQLPEVSSHYGSDRDVVQLVKGEWSTHHISHDLERILISQQNLTSYSGLIILVPDGATLSGKASYATVFDPEIKAMSGGVGNYIVLGGEWLKQNQIDVWRPIVHEINHLLGLPDLYLYEPDSYWLGKTSGPFGLQSFVFDASSDSLGWNRFLNGWVAENQVLCVSDPKTIENLVMNPPHSSTKSGFELVIVKLSETKVMVIEALDEKGFDSNTYANSVLVYTVDSSVNSGFGPVRIIPRPTPLTLAPLSRDFPDWVRFKEAPLIPSSYTDYDNYLIHNVGKSGEGAKISILRTANEKDKSALISRLSKSLTLATKTSTNVKKTISCVKGKTVLKVSARNPKCPAGYVKK